MGESVSYSRWSADLESNSGFSSIYQVTNMEPLAFLYDENNDGGYGGAISGMGMSDAGNQVAFNKLIDNTSSNDYIAASGYLQYEPIKGLIVKFNASRNMYFGKSRLFKPTYEIGAAKRNTMASLSESRSQTTNDLLELTANYDKMCIRDSTDYESDSYMELIEKISAMSEKFYSIDLTHFEEDVEKALLGLGFMREDFNRPTSDFSGGWRMRIELAKLLLQNPDVLLLDEPTNHLDIESIQWLEDFLVNSAKAVIVISHDRKFVDNITTRTIEVTMGRIYDYKVNYSQYLILRKERREQQMKQYEEQQKMIQETKDFIERFKGTYSKTLQVQSRVKMLEKLELVEVDEEDTSALRLKFPPSPRSGNYPVIMDGVGKTYGDHVVFKNASLTIERGDKVAFVGKNGEGKSTLVKCIMREIEHEGTLTLGHNVQIGYFAQNQASLLDENLTVFQTIDDVAKGEIRNKIRDLLGAFMFGGPEASMKKVKVLSGGERTRLAMIKLLLEPVNLLILDEPTNHLDMKTKDILKQALMDFDGTLIVVSHDRDFLDGLVTKVYEFGNKKVKEHLCGIYEFLETKKMESLQELEK